jgi:hypothetical protein
MSIFRGPGVLLNPVTVQQPAHLPTLFNLTLGTDGANLCAVRDELGAIAYSLHKDGKTDEGDQLFGILESEYSLVYKRDDILKCIECATPRILQNAFYRSGRYLRDGEVPLMRRLKSIEELYEVECILKYDLQSAAAEALGVSVATINRHIKAAAEDSILGVFKDFYKPGRNKGQGQKVSDGEIVAALKEHDDNRIAAAQSLGIDPTHLSHRIGDASENSALAVFKRIMPTDDEIATALMIYRFATVAAKVLGISSTTIYRRLKSASKDSRLYPLKRKK